MKYNLIMSFNRMLYDNETDIKKNRRWTLKNMTRTHKIVKNKNYHLVDLHKTQNEYVMIHETDQMDLTKKEGKGYI